MIHIPVLLHEVLEILDLKPGQFVIDGTLGSGGHAREMIKRVAPEGIFLGVDRDSNAVKAFENSDQTVKKYVLQANYSELPRIINDYNLPKADALLLDLGFSSDQLTAGGGQVGRGFSFQVNEPLIMTYDEDGTPVKDLLTELNEQEIAKILTELGEERYAKKIAVSIKAKVKNRQMETTQDLVSAVMASVPSNYEYGRIHPATRTFQALRIYANKELEHLKSLIENLPSVVKKGGRVAIISFHSLEDRIVKHSFKTIGEVITKKPIIATEEEVLNNPRSRSAKLRGIIL